MSCKHPLNECHPSLDYPGKIFCRACEKRFEFDKDANIYKEWNPFACKKHGWIGTEETCPACRDEPKKCLACRTVEAGYATEAMAKGECRCHKPQEECDHGVFPVACAKCRKDKPQDTKECEHEIEHDSSSPYAICVKCKKRGYYSWQEEPKEPEAKEDDNHAPECPERFGKRCNDPDHCPCRCHPDRYYTRAEIDSKLKMMCICQTPLKDFVKTEEEREFRRALLDFLKPLVYQTRKLGRSKDELTLYNELEDLKSRFLQNPIVKRHGIWEELDSK